MDLRDTHFSLKLQLLEVRLFDAFKREEAEPKANAEDDSDEEPEPFITYVSNLLDSLFSNCEVFFNKTMIYKADEFLSA